jgi:thymidylate synthase (FAD)
MHETEPTVYLIAKPAIVEAGMRRYLEDVGGADWLNERLRARSDTSPSDAELLVEFAGRTCYRSWKPGLNPNVQKVRTDRRGYFHNILSSAHGSVLEHATLSFALRNVSRVATHEIVRHRAGAAYSQESLRYVRLVDIGFRIPPALDSLKRECLEIVERIEHFQVKAAEALQLDAAGIPFAVKKEVTSALRRLAPMGMSTDIIMTMNVRTLRHVIAMRTAPSAEEEMRYIFDQVAAVTMAEVPDLMQDFDRQPDGAWVPKFAKV